MAKAEGRRVLRVAANCAQTCDPMAVIGVRFKAFSALFNPTNVLRSVFSR